MRHAQIVSAGYFMAEDQVASDLAVAAGRMASARAGLEPSAPDRIIVATDTLDYISPATAVAVQATLGAHRAGGISLAASLWQWR